MASLLIITLACLCSPLTASKDSNVNPDNEKIPWQMNELYYQYRQGQSMDDGINTVRYIQPHEGSITSNGYLLFNLDAIHKEETVIKAELHFEKNSNDLESNLQLDLAEISPYYLIPGQSVIVSSSTVGWVSVNLTMMIQSCVNTIATNYQAGVKFSLKNDHVQPITMEQFLKHHSLPFLLVYSNDSRSLEKDQIEGRENLSEQDMLNKMNEFVDPATGYNTKNKVRSRRDIFDNQISQDPDVERVKSRDRKLNQILEMISSSKDAFVAETKVTPTILSSVMIEKPLAVVDKNKELSPTLFVEEVKRKRERRRRQKSRERQRSRERRKYKKGRKSRRNKINAFQSKYDESTDFNSVCSRKYLSVDFEDVGWGDRIIKPKTFDAYFCAGQCSFPHSLALKPTNHATIQSLLHAIKSRQDVPPLCCVPDQLAPLAVLFYNVQSNIVLKSYADMTVKSCACR